MKRQSYKYLFYNCNYFLHTLTFYIVATFFSKLFFWSEFFFPNFVIIIDHLLLLNTFLHVGLSRASFFFGLVRLVLVQGKSILFGSVYFVKIFMINSINLVTFWVEWLDFFFGHVVIGLKVETSDDKKACILFFYCIHGYSHGLPIMGTYWPEMGLYYSPWGFMHMTIIFLFNR